MKGSKLQKNNSENNEISEGSIPVGMSGTTPVIDVNMNNQKNNLK